MPMHARWKAPWGVNLGAGRATCCYRELRGPVVSSMLLQRRLHCNREALWPGAAQVGEPVEGRIEGQRHPGPRCEIRRRGRHALCLRYVCCACLM